MPRPEFEDAELLDYIFGDLAAARVAQIKERAKDDDLLAQRIRLLSNTATSVAMAQIPVSVFIP